MKTFGGRAIVMGHILGALALSSGPTVGASFADLPKDWQEVSLLNGRILGSFPKAARWGPTNYGIMEAPPPSERELRVIIDSGPRRLVAVVTELFRIAPVDFASLGQAYVKGLERRLHLDQLLAAPHANSVNGLDVLDYEPRGRTKVADAHLVRGILIRHPDASLQSIRFFVNDDGLADRASAEQIIRDVITSLKPGSRTLISGRRVQLSGTPLTLDLPPRYTAYRQQGPDFDVYWVEHLVAVDRPAGRLGIYAGHHPQRPESPQKARLIPAVLFGVDAEWHVWEEPAADGSGAIFHQEVFVPASGGGLVRHVFFHAVTASEREAFELIAQTAAFQ